MKADRRKSTSSHLMLNQGHQKMRQFSLKLPIHSSLNRVSHQRSKTVNFSTIVNQKQKILTDPNDHQNITFNDKHLSLSICNLQPKTITPCLKNYQKQIPTVIPISVQKPKTKKKPSSNYLTMMKNKQQFQKLNFVHKYKPKNIEEMHINKIQTSKNQKKVQQQTINEPYIVNKKLCPKLGYSVVFSKPFKEYRRSLGSLQKQTYNLVNQQSQNSLQYTLSLANFLSKKSCSHYSKSSVKKASKKPGFGQNLQAWTNRSLKDDVIETSPILRKNTSHRLKLKQRKERKTKSFLK